MADIYLVVTEPDYEDGGDPVRAYEREADADAFVQSIRDYCDANPFPQYRDATGDDEKDAKRFDADERKIARWMRRHPAGKVHAYYRDKFQVWTVEFYADTPATGARE